MVDGKIDENESNESKKNYNQYLHKRKEYMKSTQLKDTFVIIVSKESISHEQGFKLNKFLSE